MARGGYRAGSGRPKGSAAPKAEKIDVPPDVKKAARKSKLSPLDYMLIVMNDDEAEAERRDRMAIAAAPYIHGKAADKAPGKKEQQLAAAKEAASTGRFATPPPPKG